MVIPSSYKVLYRKHKSPCLFLSQEFLTDMIELGTWDPHSLFSSTVSHQGPAKKARPVKAVSHYLHYQLNYLDAEKSQPSAVT